MASAVRLRTRRQVSDIRQRAIIGAGVALLAAVVLVCAGLAALPLWTALVEGWHVEPLSDPCNGLKDVPARQACFEKSRIELRHPAKGANAPIIPRSPGRQDD
jgi:hypothetical protein